jgi:hypothetical protein
MFRRTAVKLIGAGTATVAGLTSVGGAAADGHVARVRAIHCIPDAPAVDVYAGDEVVANGVEFKDVTPYVELPPGSATLSIVPTGQGLDSAVAQLSGDFEGGESYTAAAIGELEDGSAQLVRVADETSVTGPLAGSTARARVLHAVPDQFDVDITVTVGTANRDRAADVPDGVKSDLLRLIDLFQASATERVPQFVRDRVETPGLLQLLADVPEILIRLTLFDDVDYGTASDYRQVPSGDYTFTLRDQTEDPVPADVPIFTAEPQTLEAGTVYTVVAVGYEDTDDEPVDEPLDLVVASSA